MQAAILAAGKGTRMGEISTTVPKPLLEYHGKNLLERKIEILPDNITEVVVIIGHLGEKIIDFFGDHYLNKKITYVWDREIRGTGMALWQAKNILRDRFLVMMGDDLYKKESFVSASDQDWSITVKGVERNDESSRIEIDDNGRLTNFLTANKYREKYNDGGLAFTGLYSLKEEIFNYPLVKMKTKDEWGLPHTLLQVAPHVDLHILYTDFWKQITSSEDLKN